jgi:hypothetical protein
MRNGHKKRIAPSLPAMRGKALHKHIVEKVAESLMAFGFDVSAEHPVCLPRGAKDYVDIFVHCDIYDMVVEIETTPRNVLANTSQANELGLRMWIVTPNKKISLAIAKRLKKGGLFGNSRIRILTLGQFLDFGAEQIRSTFKPENEPEKAVNQSTPNGHGINNGDLD